MQHTFFPEATPQAARHPRSERLILPRLLDRASENRQLEGADLDAAHEILIKWADLESSGQLQQMHETQLQGEFFGDVFSSALHFSRFSEGAGEWNLEQHWNFFGGEPDAILGRFKPGATRNPAAVIELKGPRVHLDRDRSGGRTAVQQCWDYLDNLPDCRWGIVSNIISFRLYERNHTARRYEHFSLQELRDPKEFRRFYVLFERSGLLQPKVGVSRAASLLDDTDNRQREVGDQLYEKYRTNRQRLIYHLHFESGHDLDAAIGMSQQLLDRIIFIAFCEDRGLLPEKILDRAYKDVPAFSKVTNPRWQNYLNLFRFIDKGHESLRLDQGYNGGLFAKSDADDLDLDDEWTEFFRDIGTYDFRDEVNLDVLGHFFEKSVTELEKLREGDFFARIDQLLNGGLPGRRKRPEMPKSAKRKRMGIYYTPPVFTEYIVQITLGALIHERFADVALKHGVDKVDADRGQFPDTIEYWRDCLDILRSLKVCDPACGSGAFLFQAYEVLAQRYGEVIDHLHYHGEKNAATLSDKIPELILNENLHGVDLSGEAVEITQLALWIRSAQRGKTLADLSDNIVYGNSLVRDKAVHGRAFDWNEKFPAVFDRTESGFDCVIGNPPWERVKLQEREFFSLSAPDIATATNAAKRRKLISKLEKDNPQLYERYLEAQHKAEATLTYARKSGEYPLTGKGDINTYVLFAELARKIVAPNGRVGLLVPSGIASDKTTKDFFASLTNTSRLVCLYDFENKKGLFPDVHRSFKFSVISFGGEDQKTESADFVFFAHKMEDVHDPQRHIKLTADDIRLLNPNTQTCPIFRSTRDAEITKRIYRNVPILIDRTRERGGNPWGIRFVRMFDQTNDAELFRDAGFFFKNRYELQGNRWIKGKKVYLPLYEAKMVQMYDHRAASVIVDEANWMRQGQTASSTLVNHQNPEFVAQPRFWIDATTVEDAVGNDHAHGHLCFKDVTSPTNQRTMIAAFIPSIGVVNSAPLILTETSAVCKACLLANLNSFAYDFVARQKISGVHLNFFIVEQIPTLPPDRYQNGCPWDAAATLEEWISMRVFKLTCTADDVRPLAEAVNFSAGTENGGRINKWKPEQRAKLMAELDAAYFILYDIDRDDAQYILSTFSGTDQPAPALPGTKTTAEQVLETYEKLRAKC